MIAGMSVVKVVSVQFKYSNLWVIYFLLVQDWYKKNCQKKCNSPGEFPGLVVFLAVFF